MLDPLTKKAYSALASLRGNPDFDTVMSWIGEEREKSKELLVTCPPERSQVLQGAAGAYGALLKMYREAPDVLKKLNT